MRTLIDLGLAPMRVAARLAGAAVGSLTARGEDTPPPPPPVAVEPVRPPRARRAKPPKDLDDVTIARKVENEAFRNLEGVDQSKVDVNVADGVVWLRGEVRTPALIKALEARTAAVPEVRGVENLLHLPKTPAPQRKARRSSAPKRRRPAGRAKVNAEGPAAVGQEPSPKQTAARGKGRHPAPLGNTEQPPGGVPEETQGPDAAELDKDPAYQPAGEALKGLKGG